MFDASNPKNRELIDYLGDVRDCSPDEVDDPYLTLGTHPDLVMRLWDELPTRLEPGCRWVVGRRPVLMRRDSGVVFGVAIGTMFYALRLPGPARREVDRAKRRRVEGWARDAKMSPDAEKGYVAAQPEQCPVGASWVSGKWLDEEVAMCVEAYRWAG